MNRQLYANNMNTNNQYSSSATTNNQNQFPSSNNSLSNQSAHQGMKELSQQNNVILYGIHKKLVNDTKQMHQDQCQHQYQNTQQSFQRHTQNDIPQLGNFHPTFQNSYSSDQTNPFIGGSLNNIHDNVQDDHIGSYCDRNTSTQNLQYINRLYNFDRAEQQTPQYTLFSDSENQYFLETPLYSYQRLNTQTDQSYDVPDGHFKHQGFNINYEQNKQIQNFYSSQTQQNSAYPDQVQEKSEQQYSETTDYFSRDNIFENSCMCDQSNLNQIRKGEYKQLTHPYNISEPTFQSSNYNHNREESNFLASNENNDIFQNKIEDLQLENQSYFNNTNYIKDKYDFHENRASNSPFQNGNYNDESCSKSEQSDEQFLMNHVFAENSQSNIMDENACQKQMQINQKDNHQFQIKQEIMGKNGTQEYQKPLKFAKQDVQQMENYGDLAKKWDAQINSSQIKFTEEDQRLKKQINSDTKQSFLTQQTNQIYQSAKEEQIQKSETALNQENQKSSLLIKESDCCQKQQEENFDIIHLDKKNIVRNLIRAFIRFLFSKSSFPHIHKTYFSNITENESKQQLKKYFTKKKFNNYVIKQIVQHQLYGNIFKFFLEKEAMNYLQHSNVKCKQNHERFIQFLVKCYDDYNLLENLECYVKNKKV
ncbi:hypothetical protein TTHERM_000566889 (macronuclear) [Tetrahymena thermophila SB210]|uniref:Uncharacterized protein n=1 Tax=Tetrahymena thermophila (strain SB210) TaxID=312017 RepID=W7XHY9_TETTS|nr:hypothetical protein TTHERM_000566889 [Tetrahymena thermophila SB210]EWS72829.1 hypothetical protein TTHERM_000566889 [Tetrahymena thermophila SB210]|eukprot:XP_012654655.1 hypothetical protein TTHERM_000566889 [Tetrahymena thermophila SB210]